MSTEFVNQLFGLTGQTIVVVGGTGVLGSALGLGLAQAGAQIVIAGRNEKRGAEHVAQISKAGGNAVFLQVDVTRRESLESLLAQTVATFGKVDGLVNCAGTNSATPYLEIADDEFQKILDTNLRSTHWGCQIFGQHMVENKTGVILNIGSVTSDRPLSRVATYSASKAAVLSLTRYLAGEFASEGVRVNCLCPGFFPAEQNRKILDPARIKSIMRHTPMDRFGTPDELLGATILLMSPVAGKFITGEAIYVDGGFNSMTI